MKEILYVLYIFSPLVWGPALLLGLWWALGVPPAETLSILLG
jgi:hypothetical protein